jgi:hypothetical protein
MTITRQRTVAQERARWLSTWQEYYPELPTTFLVSIVPTHPRFQEWIVGAYPTQEYALVIAQGERERFSQCPPNWVDVTVEQVELAPLVGETPILIELPLRAPTESVCA